MITTRVIVNNAVTAAAPPARTHRNDRFAPSGIAGTRQEAAQHSSSAAAAAAAGATRDPIIM
jgi:hypothetical protein